ncbi:whole genome shotgun sequence [Seminavis robusta]|uniref:Whole genome shotgun sequence n=1 Tax=Seminavis robusta TaxID=568900 RepID=A0A9N8DFP9_9STRA|nr:whole genome shotgun sequence [Seminavis robusta]|eukprot:Sro70_g038900.1 whole genome shotgun sequence (505) ;mRNA; r:59524-61038
MTFLGKKSRCIGILGWMLLGAPAALATTNTGGFSLTNTKPDQVITSYSIAEGATGLMQVVLLSTERYPNEQNLKLRLYRDDDWVNVKRLSTCQEKAQLARDTVDITFDTETETQMKEWGYKKPRWRSETHLRIEPVEEESTDYVPRHHYWYVVMDDCSLEGEYRATMPRVKYYLQIYNMLNEKAITHFSTDEFSLSRVHTFTMLFGAALCFMLLFKIGCDLTSSGIVHVSNFMVLGAITFYIAASVFQLMHLNFYRYDGESWFWLEELSAYTDAICDGMICFLLLAIASGWTLPTDVISVQHSQDNATVIQKILVGLANPTGAKSWINPFSTLYAGSIMVHLTLAHWGLSYQDDFDSYHDLEHAPGKVLMGLRSFAGIVMLAATVMTRFKCTHNALHSFYFRFAIVGTIWFQGLPLITFMCNNFVAFHQRHPTVIIACAVLQSTSLLLLGWLVSADEDESSYHRMSHMTQSGDNNLTEKVASAGGGTCNAVTWKLFGKSKVRLD